MKDVGRRYGWAAGLLALVMLLLGAGIWILFHNDYSVRQNEHRHRFGAVYMTLNNPFYEIINEEIRTAVENNGDVLISRNPELSVERQTEEIQELLASGIEVLFLNAVDWQQMEPALELAYRAHVPVIVIDTKVQEDRLVACTVVSNNYMAGVQCARHLVTHAAGGKIALLKHSEAKSGVDRIQGFMDTIAQYPAFVVVDSEECQGQLEQAMPAMERMLRRHNDIDVVMALNDPSALGAMAALQNVGRTPGQVRIYGVDGAPETKQMIASGDMTATAAQSPHLLGRLAVKQAYELLAGQQPVHLVELPTLLITKENIGDVNITGWNQ